MRLVFFDLETGGLDPLRHPVIQVAAIAVDSDLHPIAEFERKIAFDLLKADRAALKLNSYSEDVWNREAKPANECCQELARFLKRFSDVEMVSQRTGSTYNVTQLIGHNAATFDGPFIQALFRSQDQFLPASYRVLCTLQRAMFHFHERSGLTPPADFKLETLCKYFNVGLDAAHDALHDVRATVALYRAIIATELRGAA